ncbi:hypothetical protein UlMin_003161, partial [Ulmus minor]
MCKCVKPIRIQRYAIPISMAGRDLMACAQTGSGKTAAFCFTIISGVLKKRLAQPQHFAQTLCPIAFDLSPTRQTMLFNATFPSVIQKVDYVQEVDKRSHLMPILHAQLANEICGKLALTLAFVETKKGAHALEYWLSMNGFPAIAIHGDKVQM